MRRLKVLVVEDNEIDSESVRRALWESFDIDTVTTLEEAIAIVADYDVALVDLHLPPYGTEDTMERLVKPYAKQVNMYIVTQSKDDEEISQAGEAGVCGYFVKSGDVWETIRHQMICTWARVQKLGEISRLLRS